MAPGHSLRIRGDVTAAENLTITGYIEGRIDASGFAVTVAADSTVVGNVAADVVDVDGRVNGEIVASTCVRIGVTGTLEGELRTPRLAVADGGRVQGHVEMSAPVAALHAVAS